MTTDAHTLTHSIRRRLVLLLVQAFTLVVLLTLGLVISAVGLAFSRPPADDPLFASPLIAPLETYYLANGSWDGVAALVAEGPLVSRIGQENLWPSAILLDAQGRILLDQGRTDTPRLGQVYTAGASETLIPLRVGGQTVGSLVDTRPSPPNESFQLFIRVLPPVLFISFFTGALTIVIGFLLLRRVVNPLADVIAASQAVAAGDLSARVPVRGPADLHSLTESFNRMAQALERSDQQRRDLLADIAHELRTPLTIMRGKLEGIVDGVYPADEAHVAPVLEETYTLERLVEDLRTLTLAETRQLHFDRRPVDLGELAARAVSLFDAEAQEKQIALAVTVAPDLPTVMADPQRVSQVIGNLLSNALRYVPAGGRVTLTVQPAAEAGVELAVTDNGPGVAAADLPHLFDRFWRGEKSRTRAAGGAGLGLAIARQLIEAQAGTIAAEPAPAGGLRVAVVLR
ncbi:MAG: HAMP domain-containing protein [Anaerolineales bacterium]|nr:HAMP domain-containing protein [Anaerolineales bacterium]